MQLVIVINISEKVWTFCLFFFYLLFKFYIKYREVLERFNEAQNCKLTRNLSIENEQKCFKTLRIMLKRASGQNFELLYRLKFLFFYFLLSSRFFLLIASFSPLPVRGCNNLYSWGLFLKGTGTIYVPRFLPPFICWFDRDLIVGGYKALRKKKRMQFNEASMKIRTSSCIYKKFSRTSSST